MMTMSPGAKMRTRTYSTKAWNAPPFIAPSRTIGAVMPESLSAPVNVVVFQCPCGIGERHRSSQRAHPRSRDIFVLRPVSSMKTSRAGSRSNWPSNQSRRRFRRSGHSCSTACAVFFECPAAPSQPDIECAAANGDGSPLTQWQDHLVEGNVFRLFDHADDEVLVGIEARTAASALFRRLQPTSARTRNPSDRCRNANLKSVAAERADMPSRDAARTRLLRSSLKARAYCLRPNHHSERLNQNSGVRGILNTIPFNGRALAPKHGSRFTVVGERD